MRKTIHLFETDNEGLKPGMKVLSNCGKELIVSEVFGASCNGRLCEECLNRHHRKESKKKTFAFVQKRLGVITGTKVVDTGKISFKFLFDSKGPGEDFLEFLGHYGIITLRSIETNLEVVVEEVRSLGVYWDIFVMGRNGQEFTGGNELSLEDLLLEIPKCYLLMRRDLFEPFEKVCQEVGIELVVHHFDGELKTS